MPFVLQILLCHHSHCQHLITALYKSQITISSTVLTNCNCSYITIMCTVLVTFTADSFVLDHLNIIYILSTIIKPHFYIFPHVLLLHIQYTHLQNLKCINCIINYNIVSFLHFPHIKLSCIYTYKI